MESRLIFLHRLLLRWAPVDAPPSTTPSKPECSKRRTETEDVSRAGPGGGSGSGSGRGSGPPRTPSLPPLPTRGRTRIVTPDARGIFPAAQTLAIPSSPPPRRPSPGRDAPGDRGRSKGSDDLREWGKLRKYPDER